MCYVIEDINITSSHLHTNSVSDLVIIKDVACIGVIVHSEQILNLSFKREKVQLN